MIPRVVSLLPSATEIVALVGGVDVIVGRSHECNHPPQVLAAPILTGAFNKFESSRQMHDAVNETLAAGRGLYWVDETKLAALRPDVIVTQSLCEVCSVDLKLVAGIASKLADVSGAEPKVLSLNPWSLDDVLADCRAIGVAIGDAGAGELAAQKLQTRIDSVKAIAKELNADKIAPKVCFLEWTDPFFIGGHWTPQLIEMAGGTHPLNPCRSGTGAGKSVALENEAVCASDPDVLIICPCGFNMERTRKELESLEAQEWWRNMRAIKQHRAVLVDGDQMFNRPGPRLVDALEWLLGLLHDRPDLMPCDFPWAPYQLTPSCGEAAQQSDATDKA